MRSITCAWCPRISCARCRARRGGPRRSGARRSAAGPTGLCAGNRGGGDLAAVPPGPMPRLWSLWDSSSARNLAHDSVAAARLLAAQRGRRAFHLLVPTTSGLRRQYARLIQAQLQPFGLDVRIDEVDLAVVQQRVGAGQFDAVLSAWASGPSPIDGTLQRSEERRVGKGGRASSG